MDSPIDATLAQATGFYHEQQPAKPLQEFFLRTWVHRLPQTGIAPIVIVPDGCIDLQWIDGVFRVAGPDCEPQTETVAAGATVIGFRFKPAVASSWLGIPAYEIRNQRILLDDLWGVKARQLSSAIDKIDNIAALIRSLEDSLLQCQPACGAHDASMRAAFTLLATGAPLEKPLVPWLARELALSERTLRRRFDDSFGYGPKVLDRILRYQRFLKLVGTLHKTASTSMAELALAAGYADQSHLIRESQRLAGTTPSAVMTAITR